MGLKWHLNELLEARGMSQADLQAGLSFMLSDDVQGETPPESLSFDDLSAFCQVLDCQPGELLSFEPEDHAEQARRELMRNASYQSFLAFQQTAESTDELDDETEW